MAFNADKTNTQTLRGVDGNIIKIEVCTALASTASVAKTYARMGAPDRYVVFTDKRILNDAGDIEHGMYMSLILRPSMFPSQAALLGPMSAVAMISAMDEHTKSRLGIGWVSDIYCEGVKIGGTMLEGKLDNYTTYEYIIVTFEAKLDHSDFPPMLMDMIRRVFEPNNSSISIIIAKNILNRFFTLYANIKTSSKFMEVYTRRFILRGLRIKHIEDGKKKVRRILGVDQKTGTLILDGGRSSDSADTRIYVTSPTKVIMPKRVRLKKEK